MGSTLCVIQRCQGLLCVENCSGRSVKQPVVTGKPERKKAALPVFPVVGVSHPGKPQYQMGALGILDATLREHGSSLRWWVWPLRYPVSSCWV